MSKWYFWLGCVVCAFSMCVMKAHAEVTTPTVQQDIRVDDLADAIVQLQPMYENDRDTAKMLAVTIDNAATKHNQDPWIAVALGFRESSFYPHVGSGEVRGSRGEIGYFQIMPNSIAYRVCGDGRDMTDTEANIDTAMCFLAHAQKVCRTQNAWVYTSAYGMVRCPSEKRAKASMSSRRLNSLLKKIGHPGLG